jgi:hypothetical protein
VIVAEPRTTTNNVDEHTENPVDGGNDKVVSPSLPQQPLNSNLTPDGPEDIKYLKQDGVGVGV